MSNMIGSLLISFPWMMQLFRFGVVGLSVAVVHFSIVVTLVQMMHLAPLVANVFAFAISFQLSYWGHRLWTFNYHGSAHYIAFSKLLCVQLVALAANESLFYIFLSLNIPYKNALVMVLAIIPVFTFISSKLWVFRSV